jgi:pSer/pThr/pTyr-binding forkhead associated (FHA) protein
MNLSLVMFKSSGEPKAFHIEPGKTVIGRRDDCDLRIPLSQISRKHAIIFVERDKAVLKDLGSVNGTYINNKRVNEQALSPGDHIVIGPVVFTVQIDGEPKEIRKVRTRLETRQSALTGSGMAAVAAAELDKKEGGDFGLNLGDEKEDPISELEALAGSDDTKQIDLDSSDYDISLDDSKPD